MAQAVFKRVEQKYMLTTSQHLALQEAFFGRMEQDQYGLHTIANLYYDTDSFALIRASIDKPVYKEKLRLRSYGTPQASDTVFVELKKKFKGVVYKRRAPMALSEATAYLDRDVHPRTGSQILREIDWFRTLHDVSAKAFIAYDRVALFGREDPELRVTFDDNIRWRASQLDLARGSWGTPLLPEGQLLMEVKLPGVMPLWLARTLSDLDIRPASFSKYGTCYQRHLIGDFQSTGGIAHVS